MMQGDFLNKYQKGKKTDTVQYAYLGIMHSGVCRHCLVWANFKQGSLLKGSLEVCVFILQLFAIKD